MTDWTELQIINDKVYLTDWTERHLGSPSCTRTCLEILKAAVVRSCVVIALDARLDEKYWLPRIGGHELLYKRERKSSLYTV